MFVYAFSRTRSANVIGGKQPRAGIAERVASRNGKKHIRSTHASGLFANYDCVIIFLKSYSIHSATAN
jgi:hypothetical protein